MRCKRCGSRLTFDHEICPGCGKSMVELNGRNEIEYDDNAVLDIETIIRKEEPKQETIEEKKSDDIFGEAIKIPVVEEKELPVSKIEEFIPFEEPTHETPFEEIKANPLSMEKQASTEEVSTVSNRLESIVSGNEDDFLNDKKNKKSLILGIIALIILLIGGLFIYFYIKTSPVRIFKQAIEQIFTMESNLVQSNNINEEIYLKVDILEVEGEGYNYELLDNFLIKLDNNIDKVNKNMVLNVGIKQNETEIVDASLYGINNEIYVYFNNIFDKYIKLPFIDFNIIASTFNGSGYINEATICSIELKKEFINSLDNKYFKRGIKGYNITSTLDLSNENYTEFVNTLFNKIKNNNQIISSISKITGYDEEYIKTYIIDLAKEYIKNELKDIKITIVTDVIKNKLVSIETIINSMSEEVKLDVNVLEDNSYDFNLIKGSLNDIGTLKILNNQGYNELNITLEENSIFKVNYILGYKVNENKDIILPNISENNISYEEIEEDLEIIMTNLLDNQMKKDFFYQFSSMLGVDYNGIKSEDLETK